MPQGYRCVFHTHMHARTHVFTRTLINLLFYVCVFIIYIAFRFIVAAVNTQQ